MNDPRTNGRRSGVAAGTLLFLLLLLLLGTGCASRPQTPARFTWTTARAATVIADDDTTRALPAFRGTDGSPVAWSEILAGVDWADVILIGEQHTDGVAHSLQRVLLQDILHEHPGTTLSLEFLEGDEQPLVDQYASGKISKDEFTSTVRAAKRTDKEGTWDEFYQPLVDIALDAGSPVLASNAPRKLIKQARDKGTRSLRGLPLGERALVVYPVTRVTAAERERFRQEMQDAAVEHGDTSGARLSDRDIAPFLRAQELWNATMAESIVREYRRGAPKVVHVVGGFHIEQYGGIARELEARSPGLRVLTIQLDPEIGESIKGRADIVFNTAEPARPEQAAGE